MIVRVGFFSGKVVKQLPSVTKRFGASRAWQWLFNTDVRGSFPMRTVPTSWLAKPVGAWSLSTTSLDFAASKISLAFFFISFQIATSLSQNLKRISDDGIPYASGRWESTV